ncbi:MAG TPA: twitching motility protein PilT [Candidatus Avimonoglobus intestinipullorum]|uniref:Twitching motility protein PilT n=1 Tax=Candidatus Avimonoglobus intestinipullorum TaxID=2840699 RepID=A0A9D1LTK2_9FIRM|nr:twitching motility protein PilT [Candidatus Avimonoglobus intestinipullorum]
MVELLIGKKGTGKTKVLIENVNNAASVANGNVAFISDNTGRSMYDIKSSVRMYDTSEFEIKSWDEFLGFICGIISGNFDITNIFIDGILKIVHNSMDGFEKFLNDIEDIGAKFNVSFNISVSIDVNEAPDYIKKYA